MSIEELYIPATDETPEVCLTRLKNRSYISGRSLPENAFEFYSPLINWVNNHSPKIDSVFEIEFKFDYFNSSSGRYLFEMLTQLEKNPKKRFIKIHWIVEDGDDLMLEKGLELKSLLDLNFEIMVI
jgi:SiaC family regulatory phosphoprotein